MRANFRAQRRGRFLRQLINTRAVEELFSSGLQVNVTQRKTDNGPEVFIRTLDKGDFFGEKALKGCASSSPHLRLVFSFTLLFSYVLILLHVFTLTMFYSRFIVFLTSKLILSTYTFVLSDLLFHMKPYSSSFTALVQIFWCHPLASFVNKHIFVCVTWTYLYKYTSLKYAYCGMLFFIKIFGNIYFLHDAIIFSN